MSAYRVPAADLPLKAATKALIRSAGGQEASAEYAGRTQSRMSEYGSPNSERFVPLDVLDRLESIAPEPLVTRLLAARRGYALFPLPEARALEPDWHKHLMRLAQQPAHITADILKALSNDGSVSPREIREADLIADTERAIGALVELLAMLKMVEADE